MKSIDNYLSEQDIKQFSLEKYDHIWLLDDYKKSSSSALEDPKLLAIMALYMPRGFVIERSAKGKPYALSQGSLSIAFSISHSGTKTTLLVSNNEPVGVDIELIRERAQRDRIARRFFNINTDLSLEDFYQQWTAREAFIKAMDQRLFAALSSIVFDASLGIIGFSGASKRQNIASALIEGSYVLSSSRPSAKKALLYFKARR